MKLEFPYLTSRDGVGDCLKDGFGSTSDDRRRDREWSVAGANDLKTVDPLDRVLYHNEFHWVPERQLPQWVNPAVEIPIMRGKIFLEVLLGCRIEPCPPALGIDHLNLDWRG